MSDRTPQPDERFRWPVAVTHTIDAPAAAVWAAISQPGNLATCHPFCRANPVLEWSEATSRDEVHYLSGWIYERRFVRWIDGVGYDLEIGGRGETTSFVSWRITPRDETRSELTISVLPHVLQGIPLVFRWIPHVLYVRPLLRRYLSAVTRGFAWFVTTGTPVTHNQFGSHPWFS